VPVLSNIDPSVFPAISGANPVKDMEALGIIESFSVASLIEGADVMALTYDQLIAWAKNVADATGQLVAKAAGRTATGEHTRRIDRQNTDGVVRPVRFVIVVGGGIRLLVGSGGGCLFDVGLRHGNRRCTIFCVPLGPLGA